MSPINVQNVGDRNFIPATKLYKSIIRILHICCLYFPQGPSKSKKAGYWIYFFCFTMLNWLGVVRQCFVINRSEDTASLLVSLGMFIYIIGNAYLATSSCYSVSVHFKPFLCALDEYRVMHGEFVNIKLLRRLLKLCLVVYVIGMPIIPLSLTTSLFGDKTWKGIGDMFYPFSTDTIGNSIIMFIVLNLISFVILSIVAALIILFVTITTLVSGEVKRLSNNLNILASETQLAGRRKIAFITPTQDRSLWVAPNIGDTVFTKAKKGNQPIGEKSLAFDSQLEDLRQRYESLLGIVARADDILQHLFFSTLASSIPVSCLVLYGFITLNSNRAQMVFTGLTNINVFNMLFWIFVLGIYTERKLKQPLEYVMKIDTRNLSPSVSSTIQLFTSRYLAPSLGYNVYGLFNLDSSAFLTVFGTLLTYAVVIYQFAQSSPSS